jgi:hypothetical protein
MSSGLVNANPEDVRKLAAALAAYQRDVTDAGRRVQKALASAYWHDDQKRRFEERYQELQRHVDRFLGNEATEMIRTLNELARRLDDIKRMRM